MENQTLIIVAVVLFVIAALLGTAIVAVLFLTGGQTYEVPVASENISPNTRLTESHLTTETMEEQPEEDVIQDPEQIVDMVTSAPVESGSSFTADDLREQFEVLFTTESVPAGTRLRPGMVQVRESPDKPSGALRESGLVEGKMVREGLAEGTIIQESDLYMQEQEYVVATESVEANSMLRESQLRVESRPSGPNDGVSSLSRVAGNPIKRSLSPGDVVRESDLYSGETKLSYFIPMYKRAVSIPVANHNTYSYMLSPGDLVDLYAYAPRSFDVQNQDSEEDEEETVHTLQKIADGATVLSLDDKFTEQQISNYESGGGTGPQQGQAFTYQNMTFGVSLKESERLSLVRGMQNSGVQIDYFAVLRPRILKSDYGIDRGLTDYQLFNPSAEDQNKRLRGEKTVEVIHGNQSQIYRVPSQ